VCRQVGSHKLLVADMELQCFDAQWLKYLGVAIVGILIYPVGIPLYFFKLLRRSRSHLSSPKTRIHLGFLYDAYSANAWFFELVDMLHKLTLTTLVRFVPLDGGGVYQFIASLIASGSYLILILVWAPYVRKGDDQLHLFAQVELILTLAFGYTLSSVAAHDLDSAADGVMSAILISLILGLFILFAYRAFWLIRDMIRDTQRKRASKLWDRTERERETDADQRQSAAISFVDAVGSKDSDNERLRPPSRPNLPVEEANAEDLIVDAVDVGGAGDGSRSGVSGVVGGGQVNDIVDMELEGQPASPSPGANGTDEFPETSRE